MEARRYTFEEPEPMVACEPQPTIMTMHSNAVSAGSKYITLDEFYDRCMKRIDEIYG